MKKFLAVLVICFCSCTAFAEIEDDIETHKIIGGLYSLSAAVELNGKTNPDVNQLRNYFTDPSQEWLDSVRISKIKNSIWVGIALNKTSTARHYLRANSPELKIMNEPEGYEWMGGDFAWLKAADIKNGKLKPVKFFAAEKEGIIFFNSEGTETWWEAFPQFNYRASNIILKEHKIDETPELHRPEGRAESIYESVKPSSVIKVPPKMHVGAKKDSFDMSVQVGDVIFNPLPYRGN